MGDIGLENSSETREYCKNCQAVTPNPTLIENSTDESLGSTVRREVQPDSLATSCDDLRDPLIVYIVERWESLPDHIRKSIFTLAKGAEPSQVVAIELE